MKTLNAKLVGGLSLVLLPVASFATPGTYDALTSAVDWSDVGTALVAVGALLAAVFVIRKGVKLVLAMIR